MHVFWVCGRKPDNLDCELLVFVAALAVLLCYEVTEFMRSSNLVCGREKLCIKLIDIVH